jgi:hypothetical protein
MARFPGNDYIYSHKQTEDVGVNGGHGRITFFVLGVFQSLEAYLAYMLVAQTGFDAMPVYNSAMKYTTSRTHIKQKSLFNILSCPRFSSHAQIIS